ncbi:MAG: PQQ-binding-like beta-propeller repeat protein [Fuerstiella sp.]
MLFTFRRPRPSATTQQTPSRFFDDRARRRQDASTGGRKEFFDFRFQIQTAAYMSQTHSRPRLLLLLVPASLLTVLSAGLRPIEAADWPHWRGPARNDVSSESSGWTGTSWPLAEQWRVAAGEGSSSPIVVGDRIFLTGWTDGHDVVSCRDASTGQEIWRQQYASPRYGRFALGDQGLYSGACSTPEYDSESGLLFTLGTDGDLNAWDTRDNGRQVWTLNLYDRYHAKQRPEVAERRKTQRDYGYTSSPLVIGDQLIVEVGGARGNLVSFQRRTGKELWTSQNQDEAGHTGGPVPVTVGRLPCVAVLTLRNLVVTSIAGDSPGRTIATYPWTTDFGNNIATPAVFQDSVIITSSYNQAAICRLRISEGKADKVWQNDKLASGVCSPLIHDGHVYWAWRGVHCVDFETGREVWSGGKIGSQGSCILTADNRLVVYGNNGDLSLVETAARSTEGFQQLAARSVLSATDAWPHVVLSERRFFCRDRSGTVVCLSLPSP